MVGLLRDHHADWHDKEWLIKKHGAFKHDRTALGLWAVNQTSHSQTWLLCARQSDTFQKNRKPWSVAAPGYQTCSPGSQISVGSMELTPYCS